MQGRGPWTWLLTSPARKLGARQHWPCTVRSPTEAYCRVHIEATSARSGLRQSSSASCSALRIRSLFTALLQRSVSHTDMYRYKYETLPASVYEKQYLNFAASGA